MLCQDYHWVMRQILCTEDIVNGMKDDDNIIQAYDSIVTKLTTEVQKYYLKMVVYFMKLARMWNVCVMMF